MTSKSQTHVLINDSFEHLLRQFETDQCSDHPFKSILGEDTYPLVLESLLYVKILDYLTEYPDDDIVAGVFHYYILILGFCNRLLVQQTDSFGFEQFQKYTSNRFRDFSERTYSKRFLQLSGNELKNIHHIEGRFSPKETLKENESIIIKVRNGYQDLIQRQAVTGTPQASLSLVAHFIKKPKKYGEVRFASLRHDLNKRTDALIALMNTNSSISQLVVGVDAAASEFDTPPEVFAPSFRKLRAYGMKHFTYHAGEDFFHILTGMRAIYEAMEFLDLRVGDRIGHATAVGVDVELWKHNVGERLLMRREDYFDDLVFVYHLISSMKEIELYTFLPTIALKIEQWAVPIYTERYSVSEFINAWKLRKFAPEHIEGQISDRVKRIFLYYHSEEGQKRGSEICEVDTYDFWGEKEMVHFQKLILKVMHQKQIVIETLPTSNVIIGHHHNFSTYHLYNWYKWSREGFMIPSIVVGTDDAGIFATNIYNEYCHIYCLLVFEKGLSPHEAMDFIERLVHNANVYSFRRHEGKVR